MIYYYELHEETQVRNAQNKGHGEIQAENDAAAVAHLLQQFERELLCVYKENDTKDGTPFIIIYENQSR
jgi:hypothetical protein